MDRLHGEGVDEDIEAGGTRAIAKLGGRLERLHTERDSSGHHVAAQDPMPWLGPPLCVEAEGTSVGGGGRGLRGNSGHEAGGCGACCVRRQSHSPIA